jgi:hypothetical protein
VVPTASIRVALALAATLPLGCGETIVSVVDRRGPSGGIAGTAGRGGSGGTASGGGGAGGVSDACPDDPASTAPCPCGVGAPVTDLCLLHHYPFDGAGTTVTDVVGGADGTAVNTSISDGTVVLAGGSSEQYVELPAGLIAAFPNVTVEVWTTWTDTGALWERLFDFGNNDAAAGSQGVGETYLMVTPRDGDGVLKAAFSLAGPAGENIIESGAPLSGGTLEHLALVVDGAASLMSLYSNGVLVGSDGPLRGTLQGLNDENSWLGRSQFEFDVEYEGVIHDLRIFSTARSAEQIAASFAAGPDLLPAE